MRKDLTLKPIGHIQSPYKQKFGTPRQSGLVPEARGLIQLDMDFCPQGCLEGLEGFSHLWVLFHFHKNTNETISGKVRPPRLTGEKVGLFATRSPHRPNPIGMSVVEITNVNQGLNQIEIKAIDVIDGTPIFDLKPYVKEYDKIEGSEQGWLKKVKDSDFEVIWSDIALEQISDRQDCNSLRNFINQNLRKDLRNQEDRNKNSIEKIFRSKVLDIDIQFTYNGNKVTVVSIDPN